MKQYERYKPSGIEWIGEIPEHWDIKKLKYCFKFQTGWTPPTGKSEYYEGGSHIWVTIADMDKKFISDSAQKITDKAIEDSKMQITPKGSLIYSFKLSVGKVSFVKQDVYTNEAIFSIFPERNVNLNFFYYSLPDQLIINSNENIYGAKLLNQELIKNARLIIPKEKEQTAIANYLNYKTVQIDDLIAKKQKLIDLLNEEKTAIIDQAVTKGLNPDTPMKDSDIPWLGEIPAHWDFKKLKYVAVIKSSNVDKKSYHGEQKVLLCNYLDVYKNEFIDNSFSFMEATANENEITKFTIKKGDVLVTKDSETPDDIANPAYIKEDLENVICGYHLAQIRANNIELLGEYLFRLFQTRKLNSHFEISANGITRFGLSVDSFQQVFVPLPPINEQSDITRYIQTGNQRIDVTISKIEREIS